MIKEVNKTKETVVRVDTLRNINYFFFGVAILTGLAAVVMFFKNFPLGIPQISTVYELRLYFQDLGITGLVFIMTILSNTFFHEVGHLIIYRICGTKDVYIRAKSFTKWECITGDDTLNEYLYKEEPVWYFILCVSGVITSTLFNFLMLVILVKTINNGEYALMIPFAFFCVQSALDYKGNIFNSDKKDTSDGYKMRKVLKYIETGVSEKFNY